MIKFGVGLSFCGKGILANPTTEFILKPFAAFADKLVLEAPFSIALGFQPKVRIPKITRRGSDVLWIFQRESGGPDRYTTNGLNTNCHSVTFSQRGIDLGFKS